MQAEAAWTLWSTFDKVDVNIDTGGDPQAISGFTLDENWNNSWTFRLGGEYKIMENLPVRLGVAYDLTPVPDSTVSAILPDNDRVDGTIGFGWGWARDWNLDLAYELVYVVPRDVRNPDGPPGRYQSWGHVFSFDVGYGFD